MGLLSAFLPTYSPAVCCQTVLPLYIKDPLLSPVPQKGPSPLTMMAPGTLLLLVTICAAAKISPLKNSQGDCVFLLEDGSSTTSGMLINDTSSNTLVTVVAPAGCSLVMVAVGGGGHGVIGRGGGGGSSYVAWQEVTLQGTHTLTVVVAEQRSWSYVRGALGEVHLEAGPGKEGLGYDGGDGYCGGGGWGTGGGGDGGVAGGAWGSSGGDGKAGTGILKGAGGQGSTEPVLSSIPLRDLALR